MYPPCQSLHYKACVDGVCLHFGVTFKVMHVEFVIVVDVLWLWLLSSLVTFFGFWQGQWGSHGVLYLRGTPLPWA